MSKNRIGTFVLLIPLILAACGPAGAGQMALSDKPHDLQPQVAAVDSNALVAGEQAFAFDMLHEISGEPGNLFFSPYSISIALAMTYAGARGDTETQMAQSMRYALPQAQLHPAINKLALELEARAQAEGIPEDKAFKLHVANAIWGQNGFPFLPAYLDVLAENYGAGLHLLDFQKDPEEARRIINDWVSRQTEDRIQDIVPPGAIDPLTPLVLSNAIYFKADWAREFSSEATGGGEFTLLDGGKVTVPMMFQHAHFNYAAGDGLQALELPYAGGQLSMLILLPDEGQFDEVQASFDAEQLETLIAGLQSQEVKLWLPKFQYEYSLSLKDSLIRMGMTDAFDYQRADFSGMDGARDLYIGDALHKAFVAVDEAGTEAAAATVVIMAPTSAQQPGTPIEFKVDRPFIFLIRDNPTGAILFLGRVTNPE
jgi:serpin B